MKKNLSILTIGLSSDVVGYIEQALQQTPFELHIQAIHTLSDVSIALKARKWHLILSEYVIPDLSVITVLNVLSEQDVDIPLVIVSSAMEYADVIQAVQAGARDFIEISSLNRLPFVIERELRDADTRRQRQQAETRFYKAFNNSPVGTLITRIHDEVIILTNQSFLDIVGYEHDAVIGMKSSDLNLWSSLEQRQQVIDLLSIQDAIQNVEVELQGADGSTAYALLSAERIEVDDEACVLSMFHDITDRKLTAIALEERELHFRLLAENSTDMISRHTPAGHFLYVSPACQDLLGYRPDELIGRNSYDFFHSDDLASIRKSHETILSAPVYYTLEYRIRRKDGTYTWFETTTRSVRDSETNAIIEIQSTSRDVTERKLAHEEERARRQFAEALHNTATSILSRSTGLDELLREILETAASQIPCDSATLMMVEGDLAHIVECIGFDSSEIDDIKNIKLNINQTKNLKDMASSRQPIMIADTRSYPEWRIDVQPILNTILAYLGCPICLGDQLLGFINLDGLSSFHFAPEHVDRVKMLADQAAIAIHNARLYQDIQIYAKRLELLHEIDLAILKATDPHVIANNVIQHLESLVPHHSISMTTFDLESMRFSVLATTDIVGGLKADANWHNFEDLSVIEVLQQDEIFFMNDLLEAKNTTSYDKVFIANGIRSYARVPLISGDKLLGSLNFRSEKPGVFSNNNLKIAREIAAQLAIALENARLLEVEKRRNAELTALHHASLNLTSTFELQTVFNTILDYAVLLAHAYDAHIFLYDGETVTFGAALWNGEKQQLPIAEPRPEGITYSVARSGERIVVQNMSTHPLYKNSSWRGAIIGLPLKVANEVTGVMSVAFNKPHRFDEEEIRVLELLADQAATAIHNAQLYQQIQRHTEELEDRVARRTRQHQQAKERAEAILNSSSDLVILAASNGEIYQTNPGADSKFGYLPNQLFRKPIMSLIAKEHADEFYATLSDVQQTKADRRIETVALKSDGTTFPVDVLISPFATEDGVGIVCSLRDITLQKRIEAELREALRQEKELVDLKTNFTSLVSHEFRTPMAAILSTTELLIRYSDRMEPNQRLNKLQNITRQIQRLTQLIDGILMINRSESVGFNFKPKFLDLMQLSEEVIESAQFGQNSDVSVSLKCSGDCSNVFVDEFLVTHILQNLVSNAIKYSPEGGDVLVQIASKNSEIEIQVQDHGIGIPDDYRSKLFDSFQRASNVGQIKGTGIGMTIVKRAVDAHRGQISFESAEDVGTTFIVSLPTE